MRRPGVEVPAGPRQRTAVLEVRGVQWGSEKSRVEAVLGRRPGVISVEANPVAQTASVRYDADLTSIAELTKWIRDCGYHCAGRSVPEHICDPLAEEGHSPPAMAADAHEAASTTHSPHELMGHGGQGAMSMVDMVRDMRNRFVVAALFSIPILLWSPIGRDVLGFDIAAPF
ncbi:MAG: heavy-metal-associated domain-containing protein, partial [Acidimicrobiales bacterium]